MQNRSLRSRILPGIGVGIVCVISLVVLGAIFPNQINQARPPEPVSPNGHRIFDLYNQITFPAVAIFLLVEFLLLVIIFGFRRSSYPPDYVPPQWSHNSRLEVLWTVIPALIIFGIGALSYVELDRDFHITGDTIAAAEGPTDLAITITGYQFGFQYDYPQGFNVQASGYTPDPLVVPVNRLVRLRLHGRDVVHSWWVPELTGKADLVPGYDNFNWFKAERVGTWRGECAELCGAGHATMQIAVKAVSQSEFDAWVAKQQAAAKATPSPSSPGSPSPSPSGSRSPSPSAPASPSPSPSR